MQQHLQPSQSLPLFGELEAADAPAKPRGRPGRQDRHLAAARRLAREIRRLPDRSEQQTRAGQALCRHLIALLDEQEQPGPERPRRHPPH